MLNRSVPETAGPGRPRDRGIDAEVVRAALEALRSRGYRAVTIEGIARKVKRARTTIYRRWPSKRHLVAFAVLSELGERPAADTGVLRDDLEAAVGTLLRAFSGPLGQALSGLVADMAEDKVLADMLRLDVLARRRRSMRYAFVRARKRGEIRADLNIELVLDMLTGPFYFRALFQHASVSRKTVRDVVEYVLRIARRPRAARGRKIRVTPEHGRRAGRDDFQLAVAGRSPCVDAFLAWFSGIDRSRAVLTRAMCVSACGKFPSIRRALGSYSGNAGSTASRSNHRTRRVPRYGSRRSAHSSRSLLAR